MQEKYASAKTLTTQFVQRQKSIALGTTKESSGRIYFKRPDRFRWETHEPASSASILVSNGKKVWYYTPPSRPQGKGQVMVRRAADVQSRLAMDLLAGSANLHKDFRVKEQGPDRFELTPLKPAGDIEHIELFVERPTNLVYKLILFTTIGNETQLELKNVELGPELKDAMFNFVPPENTEEIH
jgi:outer membrane lipoprotein carrier protein